MAWVFPVTRAVSEQLLKNLSLLLILLSLATLKGCSMVGPSTINHGRADYNAAINRTDVEQLILALVRGRCGETSSCWR